MGPTVRREELSAVSLILAALIRRHFDRRALGVTFSLNHSGSHRRNEQLPFFTRPSRDDQGRALQLSRPISNVPPYNVLQVDLCKSCSQSRRK